MTNSDPYIEKIISIIEEVAEDRPDIAIGADSSLVGENAIISSRELVEVLLAIEEYAEDELGVEFDWASDTAMSERRSMFRTPASLAEYLASLV